MLPIVGLLLAVDFAGWPTPAAVSSRAQVPDPLGNTSTDTPPPRPTTTTTIATSTSSSSSTTPPTTTPGSPASEPDLAFAALLLGFLGAGAVLLFVRAESRTTQDTLRTAMAAGHRATPVFVPAVEGAIAAAVSDDPVIKIGPAAVTVGVPATYVVTKQNQLVDAQWVVEPAGMTEGVPVEPSPSATITAKKAGTFKVRAKAGDKTAEREVVATDPPSESGWSIPLLGRGWGSIVGVLVVVSTVAALGFVGRLGSEALAAFFGAVAGYLFYRSGREESGGTSSGGSGSNATGGASGGGTNAPNG